MERILVVEDDFDIAEMLQTWLTEAGYGVELAGDGLRALDGEEEQLRGYDLRIDDYVTKPFSMPLLLRKIAAILRRCSDREERRVLRYRELTLDMDAYRAERDGRDLELTNREFECLRELIQNQGRVMTYQMLVQRIWNYDYLGDERVIYSHIKNLRRKLQADYIHTVRGVGYRVEKLEKK